MRSKKKILFGFLVMLLMLLGYAGGRKYVYAETGSVRVTSIDYDNLTLTVQGNGDSIFYFSDFRQKSWQRIEGTKGSNSVTMDISWISIKKDYVLSLKGNISTQPINVTLPKYNSAFKAKYDKASGEVSYTGINAGYSGNIQWRVKGTTEWNTTTASDKSLKDKLDFYVNEMAAVTVYFRTAPIKGTSVIDTGVRPSKEVTISLAKRATAPKVTVDGSTFIAKVPSDVTYRAVGNTVWTDIADTKLDLTEVPGLFGQSSDSDVPARVSGQTDAPNKIVLEFRKKATSKTRVSASQFIYLNKQQSAEEVGLIASAIKTAYLSNKTLKVSISLGEEQKNSVYEYGVLSGDSKTVSKWTALSVQSNAITKTFNSNELPAGSTLQIRKKASGKSGEDNFMFASQAYSMLIGSYPNNSQITDEKEVSITGIRGTSFTSNIPISYTVDKNVEGDVAVAAIGLYKDKEENTTATTEITKYFEMGTADETSKICQVTINSECITSLLANTKLSANTPYYFGLILKNGEKILTKITLTVLPATKVSGDTNFVKIAGYEKEITLTLDYEGKNPADYTVSIECGGQPLTVKETKEDAGKCTQTIKLDILDGYFSEGAEKADVAVFINPKDEKLSKEILTGITFTLKQPIISSGSGSISFSKGSCSKESIALSLTLLKDGQVTNNFAITDILWGSQHLAEGVMAEQVNSTSVTVTIAQSVLNKLGSGSDNVVIEINGGSNHNGFTYKTNYRITVLDVSSDNGSKFKTSTGIRFGAGLETGSNKILITKIDYAENKITLDLNGNTQILYSVNKKTWYSIGDEKDVDNNYVFNLSWVTDTKDYTVYFKDVYTTLDDDIIQEVFPKRNKTIKFSFNKASNADAPTVTVTGAMGTKFQWCKNAAYEWTDVSLTNGQIVIPELESLRVKGGKIVLREVALNGTGDSSGTRYSKEVTISIPKRANAPTIKIDVSKMILNTTTAMEYFDATTGTWKTCTKKMSLWDIREVKEKAAAEVKGTDDVTVLFRKAATGNAGYSNTYDLTVPKQEAAPSIGKAENSDVVYSTKEKTVNKSQVLYQYLKFNKASTVDKYQYVIIPKGTEFNESTAKWSKVSKAATITLSNSKAVSGAKIYVRVLGTAATKTAPARLSSAVAYYEIE